MPPSMQLSGVLLRSNVVTIALPAGRNSPRADFSVKWSHFGACLKNSWRYASANPPRVPVHNSGVGLLICIWIGTWVCVIS